MKKTRIYLIRHGQSIGNQYRRFLGHTNLDLSPIGYKQAEMACEYLKDLHIDKIYSSDLLRAYNTVLPIAKKKGIKIETRENLREIYAGEWENEYFDDLIVKYEKEYSLWRNDIGNAICVGGESVLDLQKRVYSEILQIAKDNVGKTLLIGTHATPIRSFCAKISNLNKDDMHTLGWATNASVTTVDFVDNEFTLVKYGDDEFLSDLTTHLPPTV